MFIEALFISSKIWKQPKCVCGGVCVCDIMEYWNTTQP